MNKIEVNGLTIETVSSENVLQRVSRQGIAVVKVEIVEVRKNGKLIAKERQQHWHVCGTGKLYKVTSEDMAIDE